ncbi:hypothetical protein niasHS_014224 [Heterodera schachtii]|uniref:Homeobox domain-containing protein n=1 Tax=Heterodera schachtii TaxID=97005 RepID=A0ABD2I2P7_HETSC
MRLPPKIQLPPELFSELANAFRFDFRWSILRVSSSIFDHFLAKRQQKILQNIELKFQQIIKSYEQREGFSKVGKLSNFLNKTLELFQMNIAIPEAVLGAHALISLHTSNFNELYSILEDGPMMGMELLKIWNDAHYQQSEQIWGKSPLDPSDKHRVRKRHPFPPIDRHLKLKSTRRCYKEKAMAMLNEHYLKDKSPDLATKQQLAQQTGLTETLVSTWFQNRRLRDKIEQKMTELSPHCPGTSSSSDGLSLSAGGHSRSSAKMPSEFEKEDELLEPKEKKPKEKDG